MNTEILKDYFTDTQMAAVLGITLGGLRNKLYRNRPGELPAPVKLLRARLWAKAVVRAWLKHTLTDEAADALIAKGEAAPHSATADKGKTAAGKAKQ